MMTTLVRFVVLIVYFSSAFCLSVPQLSLNSQPRVITHVQSIQDTCCRHGRTHGNTGSRCNDFDISILVAPENKDLCYRAFDGCCSKSKLEISCSKGIAFAKDGDDCSLLPEEDSPQMNYQTSQCCSSCHAGLNYGTCPGPHQMYLFPETNLEDRAFLSCCQRPPPVFPVSPEVSLQHQQPHGRRDMVGPEPFVPIVPRIPIIETQPKPHVEEELNSNSVHESSSIDHQQSNDQSDKELKDTKEELIGSESSQDDATVAEPGSSASNLTALDCDELKCNQTCVPPTSTVPAHCACTNGSRLLEDKRTCVDINECRENSHNCPPEKECFNLNGSFECKPKIISDQSTANGTQPLCPEGHIWNESFNLCICK